MRIISGKFRGKKLIKFNKQGIKPTTDKTRESIFNIVISYLQINEKNITQKRKTSTAKVTCWGITIFSGIY